MKRAIQIVLVIALCGLAISACKKKGPKTASAAMAADTTELRKQVKKQIKGKLRRENALLLADDMSRIRGKLTLTFLDLQHKVQKEPHMSREDYEAVVAELAIARTEAIKALAMTRLEMRKYINEKEWKKLFPKPKKKKSDDKAAEETDEKAPEAEDPEAVPESADDAPEQSGESAPETEASTEIPEKPESEE